MAARFLYHEYQEFEPQCKFWLATNHKPKIVGTDEAIWARIHFVPFVVTLPPDKRDVHLADKLKGEVAGILNWALEGLRDYQTNGLRPSAKVTHATAEYRAHSDVIGLFLDDRCSISETAEAKARGLKTEGTEAMGVAQRWSIGLWMRPRHQRSTPQQSAG